MKKVKITAEQAVISGKFKVIDRGFTDSMGVSVRIILQDADYKALKIQSLMLQTGRQKMQRLVMEVARTVLKCQRSKISSDSIVQVIAKGFPALAMGVMPYNETGKESVIVLGIAKKEKVPCKTK